MPDLFSGLAVIGVFMGVGACIDAYIQHHEKIRYTNPILRLSVWMLVGGGSVTLAQAIMSVFGISLLWSLGIAAGIACLGWWKYGHTLFPHTYNVGEKVLWGMIGVWMLLLFTREFSRVMYTWDSVAFWTPKMVALFESRAVRKHTFEFFNHPEYPLLLPLSGADAMIITTKPSESAAKVVFFGYILACVGILGSFVMRNTTWIKSAFWIALFLSSFIVREHMAGEYAGTADILVGIYMAAGAALFLLGQKKMGLLVWMFLPWIKSEGLVFTLAVSGFLFLFEKSLRTWIFVLGMLCIGPWRIIVKWMGVDTSQYFKFQEIYVRDWVEYATYSVHAFREEFRNLGKWNMIFFAFFAQTIRFFSSLIRDKVLLTIYGGMAAQIIMYIVICTITPEEQASFIASAISRLTLHLAPTAVVVASYLHAKKHQSA